MAIYVHALSELNSQQLAYGFDQALKCFKPEFGRVYPSPAELLDWAYRWQPQPIYDSARILDRGDKPPDWEPVSPEELDELKRSAGLRIFPKGTPPEEQGKRLAELRRQADELKAK